MGKVKRYYRATAGLAADDDLAALRVDKAAHERQAQTEPAGARGFTPGEFLKKAFTLCRRNARAVVGHREKDALPLGIQTRGHRDRGARRGVLHGIEIQIGEGVLGEGEVRANGRKVGRDGDGKGSALERLTGALEGAIADRACRLVTVIADAGTGKSRLLE